MNTSTIRRFTFVSAAVAVALMSTTATLAAPSQRAVEVLSNRGAAANLELPSHARSNSGLRGLLNQNALSAPEVTLTLVDGRTITARLQRIARDDTKAIQSWIGTFDDSPGSVLVLSKVKGVVTGFANYKDEILELAPAVAGGHLLYAVDEARLPKGEVVQTPKVTADTGGTAVSDLGVGTTAAVNNVIQDVLVLYTAATASRYGQATIESKIQSAVQAANQAYLNSQVGITMNLVGMRQATIVEGSTMSATKSTLQSDAGVANLRNQVAADVVMLVSENTDYCGMANLMSTNSTSFAPYAYGVVGSTCLSSQSLAHEAGHVQGLMHDRDNSGTWVPAYPYAYGYRRCVSDGTGFRDIMSYSCTGAPRVLQFSNPNVNYNGYPTGVSYEIDVAHSAENARALNNTAGTVAAFRGSSSVSASPAAPTGLTVKSSAYDKVVLSWTDNASNESGFNLQRSSNGVDYAMIATLGANTIAYTDTNVSAKTSYYYRVNAYNSVGTSAYSNGVNAVTPDAPPPAPPAPTSVAAANNGDGTALVSWTIGSTGATSFEVMRSTYNARKRTWGTPVSAATAPGSVLSILDSTGAGTYRYTVRAVNSGGASAYAGPASVTVTTATTARRAGK